MKKREEKGLVEGIERVEERIRHWANNGDYKDVV